MTEYSDDVEAVRMRIEAEDWAGKVKSIHGHSMNSMWYDNRPQDTSEGKTVTDVEFNDGRVVRTLSDGTEHVFGEPLEGQELVDKYSRNT
jgi:hypothetical protein|tara:strand:- start:1047 stop:1316 length:270 start_codon:yes stop_codon:yes gene_type:complete